jgi:hypothetical protein
VPAIAATCDSTPSSPSIAPADGISVPSGPSARSVSRATAERVCAIVAPAQSCGITSGRTPSGLRSGPGSTPMPATPRLPSPSSIRPVSEARTTCSSTA